MGLLDRVSEWPVLRQLRRADASGLGDSAQSAQSRRLGSILADSDRVVQSICPYCAVGCGQRIFVKDEEVVHVEGDPHSPISRGRLCPKGAATRGMVSSPSRQYRVKYRPPHAKDWQELSLDRAMDMIADRVVQTRAATWEQEDREGNTLRRTMGFAALGGATLDNEENYLLKKLFTALGAVQIENQARI